MSSNWGVLLRDLKKCTACSTIENDIVRPVGGYGHHMAKVLIIGLAPGRNGADQTGIPFTRDPSGQLLQEALAYASINREKDVFITNIVKCNPRDEKGRNRTPYETEIQNCGKYLATEIELLKPKIIIPLGSKAIKFVLNEKKISVLKLHGKKIMKDNRIIIPFLHPGYIIRGAYNKEQYLNDFVVIGNVLREQIKSEVQIPRSDILLLTLFDENYEKSFINGRTKLQKVAFFAQKELVEKGYDSIYGFRPYYYGPYSREVYTDMTWLEMNKLVVVNGKIDKTGSSSEFKLTKRGYDYAHSLLKNKDFERIHSIINEPLKELKKMSVNKLVEYAHKIHPEFDMNQLKSKKPYQKRTLDDYYDDNRSD